MRTLRRFFLNGMIMTLTSFLMRTIGVMWNAFVSGKLGADGMGLYTLIMSVYGLSVTLAASGVNLATTRMCAAAIGCQDEARLSGALRRCALYAAGCGIGAMLLLFFCADWIAAEWLGDSRCAISLKVLAASLPFISLSNMLHGYFNAVRRTYKSAAVQIFEQLFCIFVTTWLLLYQMPDGIEYACIALVGGGAIAESASCLMALVLYGMERHYAGKKHFSCNSDASCELSQKSLTKELLGITIPIAAAAYVRSALTTLENILIPRGLRANPATAETALATYGVLCGMVMPVVMLPTAILYSFTGLLVPEFAEADACQNKARIRRMVSRAMGLTLIFAIGCAGLMMAYAHELGELLYHSEEAGKLIRVMAPLIPVMYLDHAVDAMLKGLGEQLYSMKVNILDAAMCAFFVWLLCPRFGISGYVVTIYCAEVVNASLSLWRLARVTQFSAEISQALIKPLVSISGAVWLTRLLGFSACISWEQLILGTMVLMLLYFLFLQLLGTFKKRDERRTASSGGRALF